MKTVAGLVIAASLLLTYGCAKTDWIDRTLVTVDVTGTWEGSVKGEQAGGLRLELEQQGSTVKGSVRTAAGGANPLGLASRPIDGTVAGDVFRFGNSRGNFEGEVTISGDEMGGRATFYGSSRPISLRRVDASSPLGSPPR
jgi:hypothetical protein